MVNEGHLSDTERDKIVELLKRSEDELLQHVNGLSEEQWSFKPSPQVWSIGETTEHLGIIEGLIGQRLNAAMASTMHPEWETKPADLAMLEAALLNREGKISAPEVTHPKNDRSREEVISGLRKDRAKTLEFAHSDHPVKQHFSMHPVLGELSAHGWLGAVGYHMMRHNLQIAEVKASPGYPG